MAGWLGLREYKGVSGNSISNGHVHYYDVGDGPLMHSCETTFYTSSEWFNMCQYLSKYVDKIWISSSINIWQSISSIDSISTLPCLRWVNSDSF